MLISDNKNTVFRLLAILVCWLFVWQTNSLGAQEGAQLKLNIVIIEGEGAINNIRQRIAREPIVQVEDENHRPVAGAVVVFLLPDRGAGATFADGSRYLNVVTDSQGRAVARGLRPNNTPGQYQIRVTASFEGQTATATITQTNMAAIAGAAAGAGLSGKLIAILAVAGGAAIAGGVVAATRGNGNPAPVSVIPGTPSVGGPR
ncbi:MAG: carboxypeptidase-like regulatory domain-containing protein [Rhodospirillales bacterium]